MKQLLRILINLVILTSINCQTLLAVDEQSTDLDPVLDQENTISDNNAPVGTLEQYFQLSNSDEDREERQLHAEDTPEATTPPDATSTPTAPATSSDASATPTKKLKKKKKKAPNGAPSTDGSVVEIGAGHGLQDSGLPYKANVELDFIFESKTSSEKYKDRTPKTSTSKLGLDVSWLFVFGKMEAGPVLAFENSKEKLDPDSADAESSTTKTNTLGIGAAFNVNFGNIHSDKLVPFAGLSVLRNSKTEEVSAKTTTTTIDLGLQGGLKYFVGAHLALKPFIKYEMTLNGEDKDESGEAATVASLSGNNINIGLGLAKYF